MQNKLSAVIAANAALRVRRKSSLGYEKSHIVFALAHFKRTDIRRSAPTAMNMLVITFVHTRFGIGILVSERKIYSEFPRIETNKRSRDIDHFIFHAQIAAFRKTVFTLKLEIF